MTSAAGAGAWHHGAQITGRESQPVPAVPAPAAGTAAHGASIAGRPARQLAAGATGPPRTSDRQCPAAGAPPKYGTAAARRAAQGLAAAPPASLPAMQRLKSVDFYRKLPTDLTEATLSGAAISIATTVIILFLLGAVSMRTAPARPAAAQPFPPTRCGPLPLGSTCPGSCMVCCISHVAVL